MIHSTQLPQLLIKHRNWQLFTREIQSDTTQQSKVSTFAVRPDTVMIVPFIDAKKIILIREYCPAYDEVMYFFPKGKINPGEQPELSAARELVEETGFSGDTEFITKITDDKIRTDTYVFRAKNLQPSDIYTGDEIEPSEVQTFSVDEIAQLIRDQKLTESRSVAAFFWLFFLPEKNIKYTRI